MDNGIVKSNKLVGAFTSVFHPEKSQFKNIIKKHWRSLPIWVAAKSPGAGLPWYLAGSPASGGILLQPRKYASTMFEAVRHDGALTKSTSTHQSQF